MNVMYFKNNGRMMQQKAMKHNETMAQAVNNKHFRLCEHLTSGDLDIAQTNDNFIVHYTDPL